MIIQYFIDWDTIEFDSAAAEELLFTKLRQFMAIIRLNGLLVKTRAIEKALNDFKDRCNSSKNDVNSINNVENEIQRWEDLYKNRSISVEEKSETLDGAIKAWEENLYAFDDNLKDVDGAKFIESRCLITTKDMDVNFCKTYTLKNFLERMLPPMNRDKSVIQFQWMKMQSFSNDFRKEFNQYLLSFSSATMNEITIYDPYLYKALLPFENEESQKWRISLFYLLEAFALNPRIKTIYLITRGDRSDFNKEMGALEEFKDFFAPILNRRKEELKVKCLFWYQKEGDKNEKLIFHDRFIANERYCFSIGHGCDICITHDQSLKYKIKMKEQREILSRFNVFFGCFWGEDTYGLKNFNPCKRMFPESIRMYEHRNMLKMFEMFDSNLSEEEPQPPLTKSCFNQPGIKIWLGEEEPF